MTPWMTSDGAWAAAGVFAGLSLGLTTHQIYKHLKHYNCPAQQKWIVRILFMVPIYALASWMSLRFFHLAIYFDTIRNVYEGEAAIMASIKGRTHKPSWVTLTCCLNEFGYTPTFLRVCKQGTLQFCYVKPVMAGLIIILYATDSYDDGDLRPDRGYLYVTMIYNISISIALWALVLFYSATQDLLSPFQPVLKFFIVKSVIFLSFWQGVVFAIMEKADVIKASQDGSIAAGEVAVAYQNFLICFEMFLASIMHLYAFPWRPYLQDGRNNMISMSAISRNLKATLNPSDMIDDTIRNFSKSYTHYVRQGDTDSLEDEAEAAAAAATVTVAPSTSYGSNSRSRSTKVERAALLDEMESPV